jgi:hypothetical protein
MFALLFQRIAVQGPSGRTQLNIEPHNTVADLQVRCSNSSTIWHTCAHAVHIAHNVNNRNEFIFLKYEEMDAFIRVCTKIASMRMSVAKQL